MSTGGALKLSGGAGGRAVADAAAVKARADIAEQRLRLASARLQSKQLKTLAAVGGYGGGGDYSAARRTRTKTGYAPPTFASGDSQLMLWTAAKMRAESQRLMRNNPVARATVRRRTDLVLGAGLRAQGASVDDAFNELAEDYFSEWAERTGFGEDQRQLYQSKMVDGDVLGVRIRTPEGDPTIQVIEADRLKNPAGRSNGPLLKDGVESDEFGRVVRFHVAEWTSSGVGTTSATRAIDAADCVWLVNRTRASQTRGEPGLCAMIGPLEHIDKYVEATVIAARVAACQSLVRTTPFPAMTQSAMLGATTTFADGTQEKAEEMQPGKIWDAPPGSDLKQLSPEQPTTQFDTFLRMMYRLALTDLDAPLEMGLLDFSQSNFHSSRSAMGVMYQSIDVERAAFVRTVMRPVWCWVIGEAILRGELPGPPEDWDCFAVVPPARPSLDPVRETNADIAAMEANTRTMAQVCLAAGQDWRDVVAQRAKEIDLQRELGILPATVTGASGAGVGTMPSAGGGQQGQPQQPDGPDGGDGTDGGGDGKGGDGEDGQSGDGTGGADGEGD